MVGSKQPTASWLSIEEADRHCQAGASVFKFASTENGLNPDVVLVGIGTELTFEVITAASILRRICPALRVRVVNVTDLMILDDENVHPHSLTEADYCSLFTNDRAVHFNYHGYSGELKGLLFGRPNMDRVTIASYIEEGSTTTPFDMLCRNKVSRYHVMAQAIKGAAKVNPKVALDQVSLLGQLKHQLAKVQEFIMSMGTDPTGTFDIPRFEGTPYGSKEAREKSKASGEDGFFVN